MSAAVTVYNVAWFTIENKLTLIKFCNVRNTNVIRVRCIQPEGPTR